jgi:dCTP deaminase
MTALSTEAILHRLHDAPDDKRLYVRPLLNESEQVKKGQASIDVRLGFTFYVVTASSFGSIDEFAEHTPLEHLYRREYVPFGSKIIIHPHQLMLASTLEYVKLPLDLLAYVVGRSTWGRVGLIVATAIGIHPGFAGCITLELRNLGETPLVLYPGQTIGQLFLHTAIMSDGKPATQTADSPQYAGTIDMTPQQFSSPDTRRILEKLIARFQDVSGTK